MLVKGVVGIQGRMCPCGHYMYTRHIHNWQPHSQIFRAYSTLSGKKAQKIHIFLRVTLKRWDWPARGRSYRPRSPLRWLCELTRNIPGAALCLCTSSGVVEGWRPWVERLKSYFNRRNGSQEHCKERTKDQGSYPNHNKVHMFYMYVYVCVYMYLCTRRVSHSIERAVYGIQHWFTRARVLHTADSVCSL